MASSSSPGPRPDLADVKAILFDTFGSVVDWRGSLIADLGGWAAQRGVVGDWAGLVDAWRAAYAPSMDRVPNSFVISVPSTTAFTKTAAFWKRWNCSYMLISKSLNSST